MAQCVVRTDLCYAWVGDICIVQVYVQTMRLSAAILKFWRAVAYSANNTTANARNNVIYFYPSF